MLLREVKQVKQSLIIYYELAEDIQDLTDAEVGKLIKAIIRYDMTGEETVFSDRTMRTLLRQMMRQCDQNNKKYKETCERNRENARKRWKNDAVACDGMRSDAVAADSDSDNDNDTDISVFPLSSGNYNNINNNIYNINKHTQDLVRSYFRDMKFRSDPDRFIDYNTSKGNTAVFDEPDRWQALARLWESNEKKKPPDKMMTHGTSYADIEKMIFNK